MPRILKEYADTRAISDIGAAIFCKRAGQSKYSLWMTVNNIPATGSAPETMETTVSTSSSKTYTFGRKDNAQKECTYMAHRDNFEILRNDYNKKLDFLQINPDGTGWKFQGYVSTYQDEIALGSVLTGKAVITVTHADEKPLLDVTDIIQETVTFISAINDVIEIEGTGTATINIETDPSDATLEVVSGTTSVATASFGTAADKNKLTITGVTKGSSLVKITASKSELTSGVTHILVIVK